MAIKTNLTKAAIGAATAGAMLMSAAPAAARDRYDRDGISAGEIIAGAVVLGGLAAILSSGDNDRYDRYDDRYRGRYDDPRYGYGYNYNRYGNSRSAHYQGGYYQGGYYPGGTSTTYHHGGYGYYTPGVVVTTIINGAPIVTETVETSTRTYYENVPVRKRYVAKKKWKPKRKPVPRCVC